ncbi:MAG: efflux RND transporter periplasmic adaptor subunit, partial [Bacteroidetes bacterium]|nr:efflux RND transporter periplasmic adaptor subunit [Bacteroidota bacterium]
MKTNILFLMIISSLIFISCNNNSKLNEEHEVLPLNTVEMNDDQYKMAGIELGQVEYKEMNNVIKANGLINVPPQNLVSVSANMGGYVKSTDLVQGSPVTKGQIVAVIENSEFIELQQTYLESKNSLEY